MAYLAINNNGQELISEFAPTRNGVEWESAYYENGSPTIDLTINLPEGSIKALTGVKITWSDEPIEI